MKKLGTSPYSEKTHSKESLEKAKKTKIKKRYRWYYNETTLESKQFATSEEKIPTGWKPGKKPKKEYIPKIRGVDYESNARTWDIFKNGEYFTTVKNLKQWCSSNGIPYITGCKKKRAKKLSESKKIIISVSNNNTIVENNVETNLSKSEYAKKIGKCRSYVTSIVKNGGYEYKKYDWFTCIETK